MHNDRRISLSFSTQDNDDDNGDDDDDDNVEDDDDPDDDRPKSLRPLNKKIPKKFRSKEFGDMNLTLLHDIVR